MLLQLLLGFRLLPLCFHHLPVRRLLRRRRRCHLCSRSQCHLENANTQVLLTVIGSSRHKHIALQLAVWLRFVQHRMKQSNRKH